MVIAVGLLAAGAVVSIGAVALSGAQRVAVQERTAEQYTPPAISSPQPSPLPVIAIIGDSAVNQSSSGVNESVRWPARLAESQAVRTSLFANPTAGYTASGSDGRSFVEQVSRIPRDATLVMFVGGGADAGAGSLQLVRAATDAAAAAKKRAPSASILMVGPIVANGATEAQLAAVDDVLQNAASISEVSFADPLGQNWLTGSTRASGRELSASDEGRITARLETITQQLLTGDQ